MDTIRTTTELDSLETLSQRLIPQNGIAMTFLGGVGEFGKNLMLLESEAGVIAIDCGQAFPDDLLLGVDSVIPESTYLESVADRLLGYVFTHGHLDHIGALPYLLPKAPAALYGTRLTMGFINSRLREYKDLPDVERHKIKAGKSFTLGDFKIEPFAVTHSVPDAIGLAIHMPAGLLLHTGDYKLDKNPIDGRKTELKKIRRYGKQGIKFFLGDSTNAEIPGRSKSESIVGEVLEDAFGSANGRIIVTTFASHIHRIQQIVDACDAVGRSLVLSGRSVRQNTRIARELGYLEIPNRLLVPEKKVDQLPASRSALLVSGSQGEPLSALSRIVSGDHRHIKIEPGDLVIFSAKKIPGNEVAIGRLIDRIFLQGGEVLYEGLDDVHVSGHAYADEITEVLDAAQPEFLIPVHGEHRQLFAHRRLAKSHGFPDDRIIVPHLGGRLLAQGDDVWWDTPVPAGRVLVDGKGVGDIGPIVLHDRKTMADDGILVIIVAISKQTGEVLREVELVTRGLVYVDESEDFLAEVAERVHELIEDASPEAREDEELLGDWLRRKTRRFIQKKLERRPLVVPVIYEL